MGKILQKEKHIPDLIMTSPALRVRTTASAIAQELDYPQKEIVAAPEIYGASVADLLKVVQSISEGFQQVFVIGHNPGSLDVANCLVGDKVKLLPPCGVVVIDLAVGSWREVEPGCGRLVSTLTPKMFKDKDARKR